MLQKFTKIWNTYIGPALGVGGITLSIYALIVTSYDFQDLKDKTQGLGDVIEQVKSETENFNRVVSSVSTRYIGKFPENMAEIETLLSNSSKSLTIVADVIGYGVFSRNDFYKKIHNILREKINAAGIDVEILVYDDSTRMEAMREQFRDVEWTDQLIQSNLPAFKKFVQERTWINAKPDSTRVNSVSSKEELMLLISELNVDLIAELENITGEKNFKLLSERQDVFIWLSDQNKAIFSYLNYGFNDQEVSFYTQDKNFIGVLTDRLVGLKKIQ